MTPCRLFLILTLAAMPLLPMLARSDDKRSTLQFHIDDLRGTALPCRIHLADNAGKAVTPPGLPFWRDHFSCDGRVSLSLPPGAYRYEIERGPEHQRLSGTVELKADREHTVHLQLGRIAELKRQGWYSGELHVHRPVADMELLMKAEDLHVAPVITWWNQRNLWSGGERPGTLLRRFDGDRFCHVMAGEDERGGGALLFFHLDEPLPITKAAREHPSPMTFVTEARKRNKQVWIDIEKPFWWDVPVWLASGQMDSIGLANNHMCRRQMYANEAWGRPRDERRLPPPLGNGQWSQEIYYHVLNCGLRLPPSAGSASGVLPNPVGYNRVYVHVEGEFSYDKWWAGLKAGRSFVTNGPLLLCKANGELPGHVFRSPDATPLTVKLDCSLTYSDRVKQLEVIENGRVTERIGLDTARRQERQLSFIVQNSGWFLVRAVAENKETYRFASTAPFYVEFGPSKTRISKASVRFFQEWVDERIARLERELKSETERAEVLETHQRAKEFWAQRLRAANSD